MLARIEFHQGGLGSGSVGPKYAWQFVCPQTLRFLEPSLDDVDYSLVGRLRLPIGLGIAGNGEGEFDSPFFAEVLEIE